jgi:LSU ribosomal protein L18P
MSNNTTKNKRKRRKKRVRARIKGTPARPRLTVYRSNNYTYAQIIDDTKSETLVSADSREDLSGDSGDREAEVEQAYLVGKKIAERAQEEDIEKVVFDRGGYDYHGRVEAVTEGARDGGLDL